MTDSLAIGPSRVVRALPGWTALVVVVALVASPVVVVSTSLLDPAGEMWSRMWQTRLPQMIIDTITLLVGVLAGTLVLGTGLAWLVTARDFPGRRVVGWLLVTPLAIPGYVAGFVWLDTLSGPFGQRGVRSIWLCTATLVLTLYPYVYLFARSSFSSQAVDSRDVARTLGLGPVAVFLRVVLPSARPALAAGAALVTMEVLTDIGTVRLFNVSTIADGVLRVWFDTGDRNAAAELSMILVGAAVALLALERGMRRGARYSGRSSARPGRAIPFALRGRLGAWAVTGTVLALAVGVPLVRLVTWVAEARRAGTTATVAGGVWHHLSGTITVATLATAACISVGVTLGLLARRRGRIGRIIGRCAAVGYAVPGPVVAVGAVIVLAAVDRSGLLPEESVLVGSLVGLIFGLVVRFLAVGFNGAEAGLDRVSENTVASARTLGAGRWRVAWSVEIPPSRTALIAATALLLIDLMKELPITLLLRPFGFDTLAVWVWQATSESLWSQAAIPSLVMVTAGMTAVGALLLALERGATISS